MLRFPLSNGPAASPACARAAWAYLAYGTIYLGGAVAALSPDRRETFFGFVPWWAFYLVGLLFVLSLPPLIYRGVRWLTLVLGIGVTGKALTLCFQLGKGLAAGELSFFRLFFFGVAATTAVLLFVAFVRPTLAFAGEDAASREHGHDP